MEICALNVLGRLRASRPRSRLNSGQLTDGHRAKSAFNDIILFIDSSRR